MNFVMICLIGEQPVPNLLPILHYKPKNIVFVYTRTTARVKDNLKSLLDKNHTIYSHEIPPYDLIEAEKSLLECLEKKGLKDSELLFNLTGGTKPMSLAAFRLAEKLNASIAYLQSEGGRSLLYSYRFEKNQIVSQQKETVENHLNIDDYLKAYGLQYIQRPKMETFEQLVYDALEPYVCEIIPNISIGGSLEIDLIIRCGNQVGVAEVKTGKKAEKKEGIDQLNTASQREFLGTYIKRFLILDRQLGTDNRLLAEARNIVVIELTDDRSNGLSEKDKTSLVTLISKALNCNK